MINSCVRCDYDVIVVGAGPGGLQTAIGTASEGLKTLVLDDKQRGGGQAGESAQIRNLIGVPPEGITGAALANIAMRQAAAFDVEFKMPFRVARIEKNPDGTFSVIGDNRERFSTRTVVLAVGVQYRLLDAKNISAFIGNGVSYGSPELDPARWRGKTVGIVGGANSAAQAAWFLARCERCIVHMLVRNESIENEMSNYIYQEIITAPGIKVHTNTTVEEVCGGNDGRLNGVRLRSRVTDEVENLKLDHLFVLIGASPYTTWLEGCVEMDSRGFILTDRDLPSEKWILGERRPFTHETSVPGIFALGDVEHDSVKRASAAIGAGAAVVPSIHRYLGLQREKIHGSAP